MANRKVSPAGHGPSAMIDSSTVPAPPGRAVADTRGLTTNDVVAAALVAGVVDSATAATVSKTARRFRVNKTITASSH
jgi:hypothetical protein